MCLWVHVLCVLVIVLCYFVPNSLCMRCFVLCLDMHRWFSLRLHASPSVYVYVYMYVLCHVMFLHLCMHAFKPINVCVHMSVRVCGALTMTCLCEL